MVHHVCPIDLFVIGSVCIKREGGKKLEKRRSQTGAGSHFFRELIKQGGVHKISSSSVCLQIDAWKQPALAVFEPFPAIVCILTHGKSRSRPCVKMKNPQISIFRSVPRERTELETAIHTYLGEFVKTPGSQAHAENDFTIIQTQP